MSWIEWIWDNIAPDVRVKKNLPGPKTYDEEIAAWRQTGSKMQQTLPLLDLAELKHVAPYYYDWLRHPPDDAWWDWCVLRNKYRNVHAAVLNLSGWYDDNYGPEGATTNFAGLLKARAGQKNPRTHLLIGPWVHGVTSTAKTKSGEREFGPSASFGAAMIGEVAREVTNEASALVRGARLGVTGAGSSRTITPAFV